jgi:hypothetical protein
MRNYQVKNSVNLLLTVLSDVIGKEAGRRSPTKRVGDKQLLARLVDELEIKSLELKTHPLDSRGTRRNGLLQEANQRLVIGFNHHHLAIDVLPEAHESKLDRQQLLFDLKVPFLSIG